MTNTTNAELTALYNYLMEIKPYHTKIRDMVVKYTYADSFNVVVTDDLHNIFTHLTSYHMHDRKTSSDFGSITEADGRFSGIADGTITYKKWKIPDPHMGLSSLFYDHKQPLIVTTSGAVTSTDYVIPLKIPFSLIGFTQSTISRDKTKEVDAYASTYALDVTGSLVFKTLINVASLSNFNLYRKMTKLTSGVDYTISTNTDVDGNFKYALVTVNISRTFYLDYKKYKDYFADIFIDGYPLAKPNIDISSSIITKIINNIVISEKSFYYPLDSLYNPFSYSNYAVRSTPTHQIGVIDEIEISSELDIAKNIDVSNVTITIDNVGHTSIVNEGWDNTTYDQRGFDVNTLQSVTAYDPSILNLTVRVVYTLKTNIVANRQLYCDGSLVLSSDKYGILTTHDSRFNVEGKKIYFNGTCEVSLSEPTFTRDELQQFYDADTRNITNADAILSICGSRILAEKYKMNMFQTSSGAYRVPYYDYVDVYVNGKLVDPTEYTENYPYKDTIVFKTQPSLYDQITFDMFNFGKIFVTMDDIPIPLHYDPTEMFLIDDYYNIDLTEKNETSDDIVLKTVNVYVYPYSVIKNASGVITDIVVDETGEKKLFGFIRRVLNTSNNLYYMFEFNETPAAGVTIEIDVLQRETFNTLANTVMDEQLKFVIPVREKDSYTVDASEHVYVDHVLYTSYDGIIEPFYQINKIVLSHNFDSALNKKKLYVYNNAGSLITAYTAKYEDNKLTLDFTYLDKFKVEIK